MAGPVGPSLYVDRTDDEATTDPAQAVASIRDVLNGVEWLLGSLGIPADQ